MPSVAIVGASNTPDRYSHQAVLRYRERGWTVWPVHPTATHIAGIPAYAHFGALPGRPDIVCMYVKSRIGLDMLDAIALVKPQILWLNPGADDESLVSAARAKGLRVYSACTLVVLGWGDPLAVALAES